MDDTWPYFGTPKALFIGTPMAFLTGCLVFLAVKGQDAVMDEVATGLSYGFAGIVSAATLIFLYNVCLAPYRLERDDHTKTKALIAGMADASVSALDRQRCRVQTAEYFELWEVACLIAGILPQRPVPSGAAFMELEMMVRAFNKGTLELGTTPEQKRALTLRKQMSRMSVLSGDSTRAEIGDRTEISRSALIEYLNNKSIVIDGLNSPASA